MNIHKINSTSQEHQNFLAQNRIDPITGDSISKGDEVVFCASCKSVFLVDTWEYLGNRHCEQRVTLSKFPLSRKVNLKSQPKILFHSELPRTMGFVDNIPNVNKSTWKYQGKKLSINDDLPYILALLTIAIGGGIWAVTQNFLLFIISLSLTILIFVFRNIYNNSHSEKIKTFHKSIKTNTFYITDRTVGFSTELGVEEWFLDVSNISFMSFKYQEVKTQNGTKYYTQSCCIKDKTGEEVKFSTRNFIESGKIRNFLNSINYLNENFDIDIEIKTNITGKASQIETILPRKSKIKVSTI